MRYIYQEPVITTINDDELVNDADIKKLFETLKEMGHNVQISMEDPTHPDYLKNFDKVRITAVNDGTVDLHAFFDAASVRYRDVPFNSIRRVRLVANRQILGKKYKVSRWHQMDVAEID